MVETNLYQTGELAKMCGTTVRTVQYYDSKGLLSPSDYSDGGRRLYTDGDVRQLRFILMLKAMGLKLAQIKGVMESPHRNSVLKLLLDEQAASVKQEIAKNTEQLNILNIARKDIDNFGYMVATDKQTMVTRMSDEQARKKFLITFVTIGILMDLAWIGTLVLGIMTRIWWPFPMALVFAVVAATLCVRNYYNHVTYLCPVCGAEFRPKLGQFFWSNHTPRTRKLTCPCCHQKDWCVERFHAAPVDVAPFTCVPGTCRRHAASGIAKD